MLIPTVNSSDPFIPSSEYTTWASATYNYDADGQLTTTTSGGTSTPAVQYSNWVSPPDGGAENYNYDANGNQQYAGVANNGVGTDNQISSDGTYQYFYDNNGNLTSQVGVAGGSAAGSETDYSYDFRNRLTRVTQKQGAQTTQVVTYQYDAFNRLVSRTLTPYSGGEPDTAHTVTGNFIYDGDNMVLALDNSAAVTDRVLYGPAVDQVLADESLTQKATLWTLGDNQNTVRDLAVYISGPAGTQGTTEIATDLVYSAFGQLTHESYLSGNYDTSFGYTGCYYDSATKLQWNLNRWYNPSIQRWMSEDPSGLGPDSNPYRYCGNAPTDGTDPSGMVPPGVVLSSNSVGVIHPPAPAAPAPAAPAAPAAPLALPRHQRDINTTLTPSQAAAQAELDELYKKALEFNKSNWGLFTTIDRINDCGRQAERMAKYLNSLPHKYWSIGVIYGRKDKTPPNNIFGSFDHENAVWFSPETRQGNTWSGRVFDPFKFWIWGRLLYPGLQDEDTFKGEFPYDCNGQPWRR